MCVFCSCMVVNWSSVHGPWGFNHSQRVSDTKRIFELSSRTAYCNISFSGSPAGLTHTDTIQVRSNPLLWSGSRRTLIQLETATSCVSYFLRRHVGCIPEQVPHFNLLLQFATWWMLLAAHPIHKRSPKKKFLLSLKGFLQKSLQSSNLYTAPQNGHLFRLAGQGRLNLLELLESTSRLPRPATDWQGCCPCSYLASVYC